MFKTFPFIELQRSKDSFFLTEEKCPRFSPSPAVVIFNSAEEGNINQNVKRPFNLTCKRWWWRSSNLILFDIASRLLLQPWQLLFCPSHVKFENAANNMHNNPYNKSWDPILYSIIFLKSSTLLPGTSGSVYFTARLLEFKHGGSAAADTTRCASFPLFGCHPLPLWNSRRRTHHESYSKYLRYSSSRRWRVSSEFSSGGWFTLCPQEAVLFFLLLLQPRENQSRNSLQTSPEFRVGFQENIIRGRSGLSRISPLRWESRSDSIITRRSSGWSEENQFTLPQMSRNDLGHPVREWCKCEFVRNKTKVSYCYWV